ncbi:cupin domain-containing protein [Streptomyces sp. NPDC004561]
MEFLSQATFHSGSTEQSTGDISVTMLDNHDDPSRPLVGVVRFSPGARTAWHTHAAGQTLHIADGVGLVGVRDGRAALIQPGETVHAPSGEWHWHGAAPDASAAFLSLTERDSDPAVPYVEWGELVTDDEYQEAARNAQPSPDSP